MRKFSKLMVAYGTFLVGAGLVGYAGSGFDPKARTAIFSGAGSGLVMIVLGYLSAARTARTRAIAAHLGFLLTLVFAATFAWRGIIGWKATFAGQPKMFVAALLTLMSGTSLAVFFLLLAMRPKPQPEQSRSTEPPPVSAQPPGRGA